MRPAAHQSGAQVLHAGQLDLQFAFMAAGPLGKDFKDQQRAVIDRHAQMALQIALLCGAERLVEQNLFGPVHEGQFLDFVGFATAHKQRRIGCFAFAGQACNRMQTCRLGQQAKLFEFGVEMRKTKINADQKGRRGSGKR